MSIRNYPLATFSSYLHYLYDYTLLWDKQKYRVHILNDKLEDHTFYDSDLRILYNVFRIEKVNNFSPYKIKSTLKAPVQELINIIDNNNLLRTKSIFDQYPIYDMPFIASLAFSEFKTKSNVLDMYPMDNFYEQSLDTLQTKYLTDYVFFTPLDNISPERPDEFNIQYSLGTTLALFYIIYNYSIRNCTFQNPIQNTIKHNISTYNVKISDDLHSTLSNSTFIKEKIIKQILFKVYSIYKPTAIVIDKIYNNVHTQFENISSDYLNYTTSDEHNYDIKKIYNELSTLIIKEYIYKSTIDCLQNIISNYNDASNGRKEYNKYLEFTKLFNPISLSKYLYLPYLYYSSPLIFLNAIPYISEQYTNDIILSELSTYVFDASTLYYTYLNDFPSSDFTPIYNYFNTNYDETHLKQTSKSLLDNSIRRCLHSLLCRYLNDIEFSNDSILKTISFSIYNTLLNEGLTTYGIDWYSETVRILKNILLIQFLNNTFNSNITDLYLTSTYSQIKSDLESTIDNSPTPNYTGANLSNIANALKNSYSNQYTTFYNSIFITSLMKFIAMKIFSYYSNS